MGDELGVLGGERVGVADLSAGEAPRTSLAGPQLAGGDSRLGVLAQLLAGALGAGGVFADEPEAATVVGEHPSVAYLEVASTDDPKPLAAQMALDAVLVGVVGHTPERRVVRGAIGEAADRSA